MKSAFICCFYAGSVVLAIASPAAAQSKPSGLLNSVELRQLVGRGQPADQARLSAHFLALGDRYAAEAKQHVDMASNFSGNPTRAQVTGMSDHCKRLADLDSQAAGLARELAAYHKNLAAGIEAPLPANSAKLEGGAGARKPTSRELNSLAAKARTPSEHGALVEYFAMLATESTAEMNEHVALAQAYRGTRMASAAVDHDRMANLAREAEKEATDAAKMEKRQAAGTR